MSILKPPPLERRISDLQAASAYWVCYTGGYCGGRRSTRAADVVRQLDLHHNLRLRRLPVDR